MKRKKSIERRKRKKQAALARQLERNQVAAHIDRYDTISASNIARLRSERVEVIERVITRHRERRTLPPPLSCEFPHRDDRAFVFGAAEFTNSFSREASWAIARLGSNWKRLDSFLALRRQFAKHLLLDELTSAGASLDACDAQFGLSSWSIEANLLLADHRGGFEHNREVLSKLLERPFHQNVRVFAEFSSQRVDRTMSPAQYTRNVQAFVSAGRYESIHQFLPYYLLFTLTPNIPATLGISPQAAAYCLYCDAFRPIPDQYASLVKLLRYLARVGRADLISTLSSSGQFTRLRDKELDTLFVCGFGKQRQPQSPHVSEAFRLSWDGKYEDLVSLAQDELPLDPLNLLWYESLARGCILANIELPSSILPDSTARALLDAVYYFYSFEADFTTGFLTLLQLAFALDTTPLGFQILGLCNRYLPGFSNAPHLTAVIHSQEISPSILAFLSPNLRRNAMRHIEPDASFPQSSLATTLAAIESNGLQHIKANSGNISELLFLANLNRANSNLLAAVSSYRQVLVNAVGHPPLLAEALHGAFECFLQLKQYNDAATVAVSTDLSPFAINYLLPLPLLLNYYAPNDAAIDISCIAWPILHLYSYFFANGTREDVFDSFATFMATTDCARPSQLTEHAVKRYGRRELIFFLHYVCNPDVIDSDIEYDGTTDVEGERVAICQLLQRLDPENTVIYAEEISQLQQNLAVRKAIRHVAESKIHFNLEGIEKSLDESWGERFQRYHAMANLQDNVRKGVVLLWSEQEQPIVFVDASFALFRELFEETRRAFLFSDEHGLDSYLSVRIRHQTIRGAVRSIFDRHRLVTETEHGVYAQNRAWQEETSSLSEDMRAKIEGALSALSASVDRIIDVLSSEWMRILGASGGDGGLFKMNFAEVELMQYHVELSRIESELEFRDAIFEVLRRRLEKCLTEIRQKIEQDLHGLLKREIDRLAAVVETVGDGRLRDLTSAITLCRTELQNGLREISEWFQLQDSAKIEDFSIATLIRAAIDNIGKCFPSSNFRCDVRLASEAQLRGDCFAPLWDAFFLIFENVVRHAGGASDRTVLEVAVSADVLTITIRNPIGAEQDEATVTARLDKMRQYSPEIIRKEGGSGLPKLRKLMRYDLGIEQECVHFDVGGGSFETVIELGVEGILA